jgi:hypothetical protein
MNMGNSFCVTDNAGSHLKKAQFFQIFTPAWTVATKPQTAIAGFRGTGTWPVSFEAIPVEAFEPSLTTDRQMPELPEGSHSGDGVPVPSASMQSDDPLVTLYCPQSLLTDFLSLLAAMPAAPSNIDRPTDADPSSTGLRIINCEGSQSNLVNSVVAVAMDGIQSEVGGISGELEIVNNQSKGLVNYELAAETGVAQSETERPGNSGDLEGSQSVLVNSVVAVAMNGIRSEVGGVGGELEIVNNQGKESVVDDLQLIYVSTYLFYLL